MIKDHEHKLLDNIYAMAKDVASRPGSEIYLGEAMYSYIAIHNNLVMEYAPPGEEMDFDALEDSYVSTIEDYIRETHPEEDVETLFAK